MKFENKIHRENAGTFIIVMITIVVLTFIAADICYKAVQRYRYTMQSSSWTESLMIAEAGADRAMAALNSSSWTGWQTTSGTAAPSGVPSTSGSNILSGTIPHLFAGEDSRTAAVKVTVDAPSGMNGTTGQWYRIRSVGTTGLPHTGTIGQEPTLTDSNGNKISHTYMLRKFSFLNDITSGLVSAPQVSRTIEVLAQPTGAKPFFEAMTLQSSIQMSGAGTIDSFDSSNPAMSTNGLYDSTKRQTNANIGTLNSFGSDLRNTFVYGSLAYTGPAPQNDGNVTGGVTNPFTTTINPVSNPTWTANSPITVVNGSATISGGTQSSPTRVKLTSLTVPGGAVLTLAQLSSGAPTYIEIWVNGDFTTSGSGYILQQPNVHVTYYIDGQITTSGASFNNESNIAANNLIYGIGTSSTTMTVSGNGTFIGAIDAPKYNITLSGAANFSGAFVANTLLISGGASMHYDQSLANFSTGQGASGFTVGSWVEVAQ
ncbi:MAG: hypothetical protein WCD79_04685 [Chthoniobacteraceae bacterium]